MSVTENDRRPAPLHVSVTEGGHRDRSFIFPVSFLRRVARVAPLHESVPEEVLFLPLWSCVLFRRIPGESHRDRSSSCLLSFQLVFNFPPQLSVFHLAVINVLS